MGWAMLLLVGLSAMALVVALRLARPLWPMMGAALMLGAAGYAVQGHPGVPGAPVSPRAEGLAEDDGLLDIRSRMFGRFGPDAAIFTAADAMNRYGRDRGAVQVMLGSIGGNPRSVPFWTHLGTTLARHDGNQMSPAARFAFAQARRLGPRDPAPLFFEGQALIRAGDFAAARPLWARALALSDPQAGYAPEVAKRLMVLDRLLAAQGGG